MNYQHILELLEAKHFFRCSTYNEAEIDSFVASDLMSDVLTVDSENFVLITSLTSDQVARTADIVGARAVLLVNGKQPQQRLVDFAEEFNISLISTPYPMFKVCYILGTALTGEGRHI